MQIQIISYDQQLMVFDTDDLTDQIFWDFFQDQFKRSIYWWTKIWLNFVFVYIKSIEKLPKANLF